MCMCVGAPEERCEHFEGFFFHENRVVGTREERKRAKREREREKNDRMHDCSIKQTSFFSSVRKSLDLFKGGESEKCLL